MTGKAPVNASTARPSSARTGKDYSSATATPRRDMNPALAGRLGIDITKALTAGDVANLLNGQRADGGDIEGKQKRSATEGIGTVFGMDERRMPTRAELENVLAGRRVDGTALPPAAAQRAVRRFQAVLGAKQAELTPEQREDILSGRTATGGELTVKQYHERMDTSRARIGYVDLTFSAPKSVSVAWSFAPTEAERAMIHQAHHDAIGSVMQDIEAQIGRARTGRRRHRPAGSRARSAGCPSTTTPPGRPSKSSRPTGAGRTTPSCTPSRAPAAGSPATCSCIPTPPSSTPC